jgi:hypothetical protein
MKTHPMPEYMRLDDHYHQTPTSGGPGPQDHWFTSSSSYMSLDEFLEQVSYQENMIADGKMPAGSEPLVKVDFR